MHLSTEGNNGEAAGTLVTFAAFPASASSALLATETRPIETASAGQTVISRNPVAGQTEARRIVSVSHSHTDLLLALTLCDAVTGQPVETLEATRQHPFYVDGKGFVAATALGIGNAIVTRAGPPLVVGKMAWERRAEGYDVYNLIVEGDHTYFVGDVSGGVWVHNGAGDCLPVMKYDYEKYPELADNIRTAQKAGHPDTLTHGGDSIANRKAALKNVDNVAGSSRDEYPFASSKEGGAGAHVGQVPVSQQNSQGAIIKNFIKKHNIRPGDQYKVQVINHPLGP